MHLSRGVQVVSRISNPHAIPEEWGLTDVLLENSGLRVVPGGAGQVVIAGELEIRATGPDDELIEDSYAIEMRIPRTYPSRGCPQVFETGGRIPQDYHRLTNGSLCLGAPTRLREVALRTPHIGDFIEEVVVPYLYGYSYFLRHKRMPFGELAHGEQGLAQDLLAMVGMPCGTNIDRLVEALSMPRRHANKLPCPCESGRRLGKCHSPSVNRLRDRLGRRWFATNRHSITDTVAQTPRRVQE